MQIPKIKNDNFKANYMKASKHYFVILTVIKNDNFKANQMKASKHDFVILTVSILQLNKYLIK